MTFEEFSFLMFFGIQWKNQYDHLETSRSHLQPDFKELCILPDIESDDSQLLHNTGMLLSNNTSACCHQLVPVVLLT